MKKTLRITVNGKVYDVIAEVLGEEASAPAAARAVPAATATVVAAPVAPAPARAAAPPAAAGSGAILSPLAGKVVSIQATVGSIVAAGQSVVTIEAMKMNTFVAAASGGTVVAVHVVLGDAVEEGQLLMTVA